MIKDQINLKKMYNKQETLATVLKGIDKLFLGLKQAKGNQNLPQVSIS